MVPLNGQSDFFWGGCKKNTLPISMTGMAVSIKYTLWITTDVPKQSES